MVNMRIFDTHRTWEDWFGIALGVLIVASPWLALHAGSSLVPWVTIAVGFLVLQFAGLQLVDLERVDEFGMMACGLWLIASPFALGYADTGTLMYLHFMFGVALVLLAALELWQDRNLADKKLVRHG